MTKSSMLAMGVELWSEFKVYFDAMLKIEIKAIKVSIQGPIYKYVRKKTFIEKCYESINSINEHINTIK